MLELVDNRDLKSRAPCGRPGSSPGEATIFLDFLKINFKPNSSRLTYEIGIKLINGGLMAKKSIFIILVTISLAFAGCTGKGTNNISGMEMGDGLK